MHAALSKLNPGVICEELVRLPRSSRSSLALTIILLSGPESAAQSPEETRDLVFRRPVCPLTGLRVSSENEDRIDLHSQLEH
ncbi:uncharacterized [Tachysurus ichikawai]